MALSYLLSTVAVVVFAQAVSDLMRAGPNGIDLTSRVLNTARAVAATIPSGGGSAGALVLGDPTVAYGDAATHFRGDRVAIPELAGAGTSAPVTVAVIVDGTFTVQATSFPAAFAVGTTLPASRQLPDDALRFIKDSLAQEPAAGLPAISALSTTPAGVVAWAIVELNSPVRGPEPTQRRFLFIGTPTTVTGSSTHIGTVAAIVALSLPVGLAFGWLVTRDPRRRMRRLAAASNAVAGGDFATRLDPVSNDELGQLERHFNTMTEHLETVTNRERELAVQNARLTERGRLSRDLHDSLSQELFTLNMLAGGLHQALPPESALRPHAAVLCDTAERATSELRAMLLDLRPSTIDERDLTDTLNELCSTFRDRFGLHVTADVRPVTLDAPRRDAVVRLTQEGLTNAAKHSDADAIAVRFVQAGVDAVLTIEDNGHGFDPHESHKGYGLRLMRERVAELGGQLDIDSSVGAGTTITVRFAIDPVRGPA